MASLLFSLRRRPLRCHLALLRQPPVSREILAPVLLSVSDLPGWLISASDERSAFFPAASKVFSRFFPTLRDPTVALSPSRALHIHPSSQTKSPICRRKCWRLAKESFRFFFRCDLRLRGQTGRSQTQLRPRLSDNDRPSGAGFEAEAIESSACILFCPVRLPSTLTPTKPPLQAFAGLVSSQSQSIAFIGLPSGRTVEIYVDFSCNAKCRAKLFKA